MEEDGWTNKVWGDLLLRTHIQEVVENVVDLNHFPHVHGYKQVSSVGQPTVDECHFTTSMKAIGRYNLPFARKSYYNVDVEFHLWGLGYFFWETLSDDGVRTRNWIFCVPDNDELHMHYAVAVGEKEGPNTGAMKLLPWRMLRWLIRSLLLYETGVTFRQDKDIWNEKTYLENPLLISTDGAFFKYREYCQQFYKLETLPSTDI